MTSQFLRVSALAFVFTCSAGFARDAASATEDALAGDDAALYPVSVTATRTPEALSDVLASTTIIDRATIEARQATSVQELLRGEAGIELVNNGGPGKVTSLFMRGAESDQVLVLVDGIKLGSATAGTTAFQFLPVEQIDHIEIVRGPRSSLYGSEALGGVIQIFTRTGQGPTRPELDLAGGSHDGRQISGGLSGSTERFWYAVSGSYQSTDGYNSCTGKPSDPVTFAGGGGCFTVEPDDDGYRNASYSVRAGMHTSEASDVEVNMLRARGATEFDGDFTNRSEFIQQAIGVTGHWSPISSLRFTARAGQSRDDETDDENRVYAGKFDTKRFNGTLQGDWTVMPKQVATLGVDFQRDQVDTDPVFDVSSRRDTGVFGQYDGDFGAHHLVLSARHDSNQQFGGKTTGSAAWGYRLTDTMRVIASYGSAFRAPSFNELYYPFGFGNPNLKPESSRTVEIGVDQQLKGVRWALRGFQTRVNDLINFDQNFLPANIDKARIRGVELEAHGNRAGWIWGLTGTYLDARDRSGGFTDGDRLQRRPRGSGGLELGHAWHQVSVGARLNIESERFDDAANKVPLGGFTTLDLLGTWNITKQLSLQAKAANLGDKPYQTAQFYPQDRRNYWLTVRFTP